MKYRKVLSRRTLLRGAGGIAIALPFIDAMRSTSVYGAEPEPPVRCITLFFGLGVPKEWQADGFTGALAPLAPFADKLAMCRGVNLYEADGSENNHFDGSGGVFTALEPNTISKAGGPSIDQVIKKNAYPEGTDTLVDTLQVGSFFRRKLNTGASLTRYVHCWDYDGNPIDPNPIETPEEIFERLFGSVTIEPGQEKARRYQRSVLDSVLGQYQHIISDASNLGKRSRSRIKDHLDKIRELEKKLFPKGALNCEAPANPGEPALLHGQPVDEGGPTIDPAEWQTHFHLMCDLYALGLHCDLFRFGNLMFQSGGERMKLKGEYHYNGQLFTTFDDAETSHEYWHAYPSSQNGLMEQHTHFIMAQFAYFMQQINDPNYADANGRTVLDNALLMIGTELGNGNAHNLESVFHVINGANERFKVGQHHDFGNVSGTDFYNTCLSAYGIQEQMGTPGASTGLVSGLLA